MLKLTRILGAGIALLAALVTEPAGAEPLEDGITALTAKGFKAKSAAVENLAATGDYEPWRP